MSSEHFGLSGFLLYLILYAGALVASSLISYAKHKKNPGYMALGASGAVSAVLFSFILMYPQEELTLMFLIPIKAYILGGLYLLYSHYMSKQNMDNIGHDAHFYGAVFGFLFTLLLSPRLFGEFLRQLPF